MTNILETTPYASETTLSDKQELELEREQFIEGNARAALKLELAGLAIKTQNTIFPEYIED